MPFHKETCPYCGDTHCQADWTDVGIGHVQTGPFHCDSCGATEIGPHDEATPSETENAMGWYAPNSANLPKTVSTINGQFVDAQTALAMYRRGLVPGVPFQLQTSPEEFARLLKGIIVEVEPLSA